MSDRLDLDMEAERALDGADTPVGEWDDDLLEDFPEDDPASNEFGESEAAGRGQSAASDRASSAAKNERALQHRGDGAGKGAGLGSALWLCSLMLLSGLAIGGGVLIATDSTYVTLLDFGGFQDVAAITDLGAHPVNAFWLAVAVTVLSGLLAAIGIVRRMRTLQATVQNQAVILDAVSELDPDKPESWRHEAVLGDPDLAAATGNLLGHYHLQQAKLTRYVGLEGELHRLEKAIADDSQIDLQGNWEDPSAGSLADQTLRLMSARDEARRAAAEQRETFADKGPDLVAGLRDARRWQGATVEQVQHHGAAIERLNRMLAKLTAMLPADEDHGRRLERLVSALTAVRDAVGSLPARGQTGQDSPNLSALIERISRLGFQIAMEVARLGAKGERLLPLTQDLEDVITEFRNLADASQQSDPAQQPLEQVLATLRGRLGELDPEILKATVPTDLPGLLTEIEPIASETSAAMSKLAQGFGSQTARLQQLGEMMTQITGLPVDDGGDPHAEAGSGMLVDRYDPFASGSVPDGGLVADPFASSSGSIFEDPVAAGSDFARAVLPGEEEGLTTPSLIEPEGVARPEVGEPTDRIAATDAPPVLQSPDPVASSGPADDLVPPGLRELPGTSEQQVLPSEDEKVYDLREFDAQLLPSDPGEADVGAPVHDLSEFDAVRIA